MQMSLFKIMKWQLAELKPWSNQSCFLIYFHIEKHLNLVSLRFSRHRQDKQHWDLALMNCFVLQCHLRWQKHIVPCVRTLIKVNPRQKKSSKSDITLKKRKNVQAPCCCVPWIGMWAKCCMYVPMVTLPFSICSNLLQWIHTTKTNY